MCYIQQYSSTYSSKPMRWFVLEPRYFAVGKVISSPRGDYFESDDEKKKQSDFS